MQLVGLSNTSCHFVRVASLQTLTQQSGHNKKGKEQPQKLALLKKKDNVEDKVKSDVEIRNEKDQNEGKRTETA